MHAHSAAFARQVRPQRGHRGGAIERCRTRPRYARKSCMCGTDAPSAHNFPSWTRMSNPRRRPRKAARIGAASDDVAVCSAGTCRTKTVVDVRRRAQRDGGSAARDEAPTRRYDTAAATGCRRARCRHDICCPPTNYRCPLICATVRNVCATGEPRAVHTNGSSCPLPAQALTVLHRC